MVNSRKQVIRIVFDVLDERKQHLRVNEDLSVRAADPDEAIDWVFAEMQRQYDRLDIHLARVRICA